MTFGKTFSLDRNKLLYECKISWNKVAKGIENSIFKGFGIIYVKSTIGKWCGILVIHRQ